MSHKDSSRWVHHAPATTNLHPAETLFFFSPDAPTRAFGRARFDVLTCSVPFWTTVSASHCRHCRSRGRQVVRA